MHRLTLQGILLCLVGLAAATCWADTITSALGHQGPAFAPGIVPSKLGWGPDDKPYPAKFAVNPPDGAEMVWVPAGEFMMGSPAGDGWADENPQHKVRITKGFWIGKFTVTNEQYARLLAANGGTRDAGGHDLIDLSDSSCGIEYVGNQYRAKAGQARHPAAGVSWHGAKAYCDRYGYVLPTEAQWEYAARGPQGRKYPWGDDWGEGMCCNDANHGKGDSPTMEVGSLPAGDSWCGAGDMAGNVSQWCADWYDPGYYARSPEADPSGPTTGEGRPMRGGSWFCYASGCRSAGRFALATGGQSSGGGFRVARTP